MSSFELDPAAIARVLAEQPAVDALRRRAGRTVNEARQAPRSGRQGGHEVDKIAVGDTTTDEDGAVVEIDWPSSVWHLVEFGSANNTPYRSITRAAQNAGLRVIDKRGHA